MRSVPFEFVSGLAAEFGAVECCWRESERSFTAHVAECWFAQLPSAFAATWAVVASGVSGCRWCFIRTRLTSGVGLRTLF
ncbi:MAG: hypothetical protein AAF572_28965 [Cyanobacteria bacterium P01_B01_bin.77]